MSATALIINRISASLAANELALIQPPTGAVTLTTIGDLLRPWDEVFPGVRRLGDDDRRDLFSYGPGTLKKPKFHPHPRRSRRALLPPRSIAAPVKSVSPELFTSFQAIWEWYTRKGLANPALLEKSFSSAGLNNFVMPLMNEVDHYPLGMCLEEFGYNDNIYDVGMPSLILPHDFYEDEWAWVVEGIFSGVSGFDWVLRELIGRDDFLKLSAKDRKLVKEISCTDLAQAYFDFEGEKTLPLAKMENWTTTYFADLAEKYPWASLETIPLICSDIQECEIYIDRPEHIDFCIDYAEALSAMYAPLPNVTDIHENDEGAADQLVKEVCAIWRKSGRKPTVKVVPTISERMQNGDL